VRLSTPSITPQYLTDITRTVCVVLCLADYILMSGRTQSVGQLKLSDVRSGANSIRRYDSIRSLDQTCWSKSLPRSSHLIFGKHGFSAHTDDLPLNDLGDPSFYRTTLLSRLSVCVKEVKVKVCMACSRLRLNASKTELNWLGATRYVKQCPAGPAGPAADWLCCHQPVGDSAQTRCYG